MATGRLDPAEVCLGAPPVLVLVGAVAIFASVAWAGVATLPPLSESRS